MPTRRVKKKPADRHGERRAVFLPGEWGAVVDALAAAAGKRGAALVCELLAARHAELAAAGWLHLPPLPPPPSPTGRPKAAA